MMIIPTFRGMSGKPYDSENNFLLLYCYLASYTLPIVYTLYRPLYHCLHHVLFIMLLDSLFNSNSNLDKIMLLMPSFSESLTLAVFIEKQTTVPLFASCSVHCVAGFARQLQLQRGQDNASHAEFL